MTTRLSATDARQGVRAAAARRRLFNGAPDATLLALSAGLTVGTAFAPGTQAQGVGRTSTYDLSPANNPITFGSATNIASPTGSAVYGAAGTNWTVTNQGTLMSGYRDGVQLQSLGTVTNAGSIYGVPAGVDLAVGGTVTNQAGGTITGGGGVSVLNGAGTVINAGSISGSYVGVSLLSGGSVTNQAGGAIASSGVGVLIFGGLGSVINAGTISATMGDAIYLSTGGGVTNRRGGSISGGVDGAYASGGTATVTNAGRISGSNDGVALTSGGGVTNRRGGTISGGTDGVYASGGRATVINAGRISDSNYGVALASGGGVTNRRGGTISGGTDGIYTYGGATVTNAGTITGGTDSVQFAGSGANVLTLRTGSVLNGNAVGSTAQGATNALDLQGTGTANNAFIDFTTLAVQASGVWTLNNSSAFSSAAAIDSGNLQVGDATHTTAQLTSPTLTVNPGAELSGYGTISGAVSNNGTVVPAAIGSQLTINGSFVQAASGTLAIAIAPSGQNAMLLVNGTAQLAGTLALLPHGSGFLPGTTYTVVEAVPEAIVPPTFGISAATVVRPFGVTGGFTSVTLPGFILLAPVETATASAIDITLTQLPATIAAATPNQYATATGIDSLLAQGAGPVPAAIDALPTDAAVRSALTRFSGEAYTGFQTAEIDSGAAFLGQITQSLYRARRGFAAGGTQAQASGATGGRVQLAANGASPYMLPDPDAQRWSVWVNGYGQSSAVPGNGNASQFNGTAAGTTAGADYQVNRNLLLGAAIGFTSTSFSVNNSGAQGNADDGQFALYANYSTGPAYVAGTIGYSHAEGTMIRDISLPDLPGQARGSISGNQVLGSAETGYDFKLPNGIVATPFAGLQLAAYTQNAMAESTGGPLALAVQQASASSVVSQFGGRFATDLHLAGLTISTQAQLGWAHEFASTARSITASFVGAPSTPFTVSGAEAGRDHAIVGFGVATAITQNTSLFVRYDGAIDGSDNSNALSGGIRMVW